MRQLDIQIAIVSDSLSEPLTFNCQIPFCFIFKSVEMNHDVWMNLWTLQLPNEIQEISILNGYSPIIDNYLNAVSISTVWRGLSEGAFVIRICAKLLNDVLFLSEIVFHEGFCSLKTKSFALSAIEVYHASLRNLIAGEFNVA